MYTTVCVYTTTVIELCRPLLIAYQAQSVALLLIAMVGLIQYQVVYSVVRCRFYQRLFQLQLPIVVTPSQQNLLLWGLIISYPNAFVRAGRTGTRLGPL